MSIARDLARLRTPVQPVYGGVSTDYISGLIPSCENGSTLTVTSGAAYIPGINGVLDVPTSLTINLTGYTSGVWYSLYLFNNSGVPAIELVATVPEAPYRGTARIKTGDNTRRLLGMFRSNITGGVWPFYSDNTLEVFYLVDLGTGGFRVLSDGRATVKTVVDVSNVVPLISRVVNISLTSSNSLGATVVGISANGFSGFGVETNGNTKFRGTFTTDTTQKLQYLWNQAPNGGMYFDVTGYRFQR